MKTHISRQFRSRKSVNIWNDGLYNTKFNCFHLQLDLLEWKRRASQSWGKKKPYNLRLLSFFYQKMSSKIELYSVPFSVCLMRQIRSALKMSSLAWSHVLWRICCVSSENLRLFGIRFWTRANPFSTPPRSTGIYKESKFGNLSSCDHYFPHFLIYYSRAGMKFWILYKSAASTASSSCICKRRFFRAFDRIVVGKIGGWGASSSASARSST